MHGASKPVGYSILTSVLVCHLRDLSRRLDRGGVLRSPGTFPTKRGYLFFAEACSQRNEHIRTCKLLDQQLLACSEGDNVSSHASPSFNELEGSATTGVATLLLEMPNAAS